MEQKTIISILTPIKAGSLLLIFIFLICMPIAIATEYYVVPSASNESGESVSGEIVQEGELREIPYWMFFLLLCISPISSSPEFWYIVKFVPALGGIKRVNRSNIMTNSCREKISDIIKSTPGIYFSEIARETGINRGTLRYHLELLEKERVIESRTIKGKVRFFRNDSTYDENEKMMISTLRDDISRKIIDEVSQCRFIDNNSLAEKLGVSASTVSWHVKYMKERGDYYSR